jgi:Flp pilus assembly protein TadG
MRIKTRSRNHAEGILERLHYFIRIPHISGASNRVRRGLRGDEGATIVATALASTILAIMFIGIFDMSLALYNYHFVADAAREATRYAIVRGSASCTNSPNMTNCNATSAEIQTYVQNLGYPYASSLTVTATWLTAVSSGSPATTTWTACTSGICNAPGNLVHVVVTEAFPLNIPFCTKTTINLSSTSQMAISQ